MALRLWYRVSEHLGKVGTAERKLPVVHDQVVQAVEGHRVNQIELDLPSLLAGLDPAVIHSVLSP